MCCLRFFLFYDVYFSWYFVANCERQIKAFGRTRVLQGILGACFGICYGRFQLSESYLRNGKLNECVWIRSEMMNIFSFFLSRIRISDKKKFCFFSGSWYICQWTSSNDLWRVSICWRLESVHFERLIFTISPFNVKESTYSSLELSQLMIISLILICLFIIMIAYYPLLSVASTLMFTLHSFLFCFFSIYCFKSCIFMDSEKNTLTKIKKNKNSSEKSTHQLHPIPCFRLMNMMQWEKTLSTMQGIHEYGAIRCKDNGSHEKIAWFAICSHCNQRPFLFS